MRLRHLPRRLLLAAAALPGAGPRRDVILLYHSVGPGGVPADAFEQQLDHLRAHYDVRRLDELGRQGDRPAAYVTFDDGYVDNVEVAAPLLEARQLPATFFVVTNLLGGPLQTSSGPRELMGAHDVRRLAEAGHELGSHTRSHAWLDTADAATLVQEVEGSRAELETVVGSAVTSFAYPKGKLSPTAVRAVADAGYRRAVTTREAHLGDNEDPFLLPRVAVHPHTSMGEFRARLTAALGRYERLRRRR